MTSIYDFKVVSNDLREELRNIRKESRYEAVLTSLRKDQTVFVASSNGHDTAGSIRSLIATRAPKMRVVGRSTTIDTVPGIVLWLEPKKAST